MTGPRITSRRVAVLVRTATTVRLARLVPWVCRARRVPKVLWVLPVFLGRLVPLGLVAELGPRVLLVQPCTCRQRKSKGLWVLLVLRALLALRVQPALLVRRDRWVQR